MGCFNEFPGQTMMTPICLSRLTKAEVRPRRRMVFLPAMLRRNGGCENSYAKRPIFSLLCEISHVWDYIRVLQIIDFSLHDGFEEKL